MTNENNGQPSQEEQRKNNVHKTLEDKFIQDNVGSTLVKGDPHLYTGSLGYQAANDAYDSSLRSDKAQEFRKQAQQRKQQEFQQQGFPLRPEVSDTDVSYEIFQQKNEIQGKAKISELYDIAKKVGANLEFELPENLPDLSKDEIIKEAHDSGALGKNGLDLSKLDQSYQDAFLMHKTIADAYDRAAAFNATHNGYFADLNNQANKIAEQYQQSSQEGSGKKAA